MASVCNNMHDEVSRGSQQQSSTIRPTSSAGNAARRRAATPPPRASLQNKDAKSHSDSIRGLATPPERKATPAEQKASLHAELRAGFLRKVYGILSAQMAMTVAVAAICMLTPAIRTFLICMGQSESLWIQLGIFIPTMGSLLGLHFVKDVYPMNYYVLFIFTFGISLDVGFVCAVLYEAGIGELILQAFAITTSMFLILTAYTFRSGKNFSYLHGFLSMMLPALVATGFFGLFYPSLVQNLLYPVIGALTFSGYIIVDTWRLETILGCYDYMVAAIDLLIIIQLTSSISFCVY